MESQPLNERINNFIESEVNKSIIERDRQAQEIAKLKEKIGTMSEEKRKLDQSRKDLLKKRIHHDTISNKVEKISQTEEKIKKKQEELKEHEVKIKKINNELSNAAEEHKRLDEVKKELKEMYITLSKKEDQLGKLNENKEILETFLDKFKEIKNNNDFIENLMKEISKETAPFIINIKEIIKTNVEKEKETMKTLLTGLFEEEGKQRSEEIEQKSQEKTNEIKKLSDKVDSNMETLSLKYSQLETQLTKSTTILENLKENFDATQRKNASTSPVKSSQSPRESTDNNNKQIIGDLFKDASTCSSKFEDEKYDNEDSDINKGMENERLSVGIKDKIQKTIEIWEEETTELKKSGEGKDFSEKNKEWNKKEGEEIMEIIANFKKQTVKLLSGNQVNASEGMIKFTEIKAKLNERSKKSLENQGEEKSNSNTLNKSQLLLNYKPLCRLVNHVAIAESLWFVYKMLCGENESVYTEIVRSKAKMIEIEKFNFKSLKIIENDPQNQGTLEDLEELPRNLLDECHKEENTLILIQKKFIVGINFELQTKVK
jgi:DNA repair exonuclease SbcCD ATPase subunit